MTNKLNTQPYKGARDFYPEDMAIQNYIFDTWKKVCSSYGFAQYDFPIIEPFEIFAAKTGQEIVNEQLFSFEDKAGRKLAIRPELTPGTVRMIAQKYKELQKPIKWFMIGNNWRFEKPQLGRGREFNQLEVNIFGIDDVIADYEIFSIIISIMQAFGADETMFSVLISDRRLISALLNDTLNIDSDKQIEVRRIMDKKAKLTKQEFETDLMKLTLTKDQIQKIYMFTEAKFDNLSEIIPQAILTKNKGYLALRKVFDLLNKTKLAKYCMFDPSIIRGFDYSDGIVYEVFDKNPKNNRSMFGGERFDKLINIFGNFELPATGFAMGDVTLLEFLKAWNLLPNGENANSYLVTLWPTEDEESSNEYLMYSIEVSKTLRTRGYQVDTWLETKTKIEKQLKYADRKNIQNVVLLGPDELKNNTITIKNMKTGTQETKVL